MVYKCQYYNTFTAISIDMILSARHTTIMTPNQINALHQYVRRHKPIPVKCEACNDREALDLANISPDYNADTYTRDINNWRYLCRTCHVKSDGRLAKMHASLWLKPRKRDTVTGKFIKTVHN